MSKHVDVNELLEALDKKSGVGHFDAPHMLNKVENWIPTGCLPLDVILGGGIPVGRMIEIYGDTSTGKSLVAAHIVKQTQDMGGIAVLFDTETTTSGDILDVIGVDRENLIYSTPDTVEQVWRELDDLLERKDKYYPDDVMTIVWDSVAATSSEEELEGLRKKGLNSHSMALHARLLSIVCRQLPRMIARRKIALVIINQTRENIGVLFGDTKTTFGGKSLGFYASVRLEISKIRNTKSLVEGGGITGIETRMFVSKSKVGKPFGTCEVPIVFDKGIDDVAAIFLWLKKIGKLVTAGSWYKLSLAKGEKKFQYPMWPATYAENKTEIDNLLWQTAGYMVVDPDDTAN